MDIYSGYSQLNRYREAKGRVRIALYVRCSSDEQKKSGYTIKDQLDYGYLFAKENELIVVDEYFFPSSYGSTTPSGIAACNSFNAPSYSSPSCGKR